MTLPPNDPSQRGDADQSGPRAPQPGAGSPAAARPAAAHGVDGAGHGYVGAHRAPAAAGGGPGRPAAVWWLVGAGVVVLAVIVGLFFLGLRVGTSGGGEAAPIRTATDADGATGASGAPETESGASAQTSTAPGATGPGVTGPDATGSDAAAPRATGSATGAGAAADAAAPPGPLAPGVHDWNALHGGECLSGYTSPWELQFTVVDCAADHNAQLVTKGAFAEDAAAPYPGEAELASRLNLLCTAPGVLDYAAAQALPDVQWQGAYPAGDAQWTAGDRSYFCFFSRTSGEPLGASLATAPAG